MHDHEVCCFNVDIVDSVKGIQGEIHGSYHPLSDFAQVLGKSTASADNTISLVVFLVHNRVRLGVRVHYQGLVPLTPRGTRPGSPWDLIEP
jgi:hypothetical protein